jgi:hypothetical protein
VPPFWKVSQDVAERWFHNLIQGLNGATQKSFT